jgi:hypothetical protein
MRWLGKLESGQTGVWANWSLGKLESGRLWSPTGFDFDLKQNLSFGPSAMTPWDRAIEPMRRRRNRSRPRGRVFQHP